MENTIIGNTPMPRKLAKRIDELLESEWEFLEKPWPMCPKIKTFHRSEMKPIPRIQEMKDLLKRRLGSIAVFFFLSTIWSKHYFPGPYNALEKGIAFLYFFVAGETMDSMSPYIPKTTFHVIYSTFLKIERSMFEKEINRCFSSMFSTPEIRIRSANWRNPPLFKHVTILLDGHDSRATYGEDKAAMYSYKLKKSGLRTQVAIDVNGMVLFTSKSASCRDNNDGKMLLEMGIGKKVHSMDCIALDGGYTQYLGDLMEKEKDLKECNFCFPIRKKRQQPLHDDEANFNAMFGGFRSTSEEIFGDLGKTFAKFNNKEIVRTASKREFNLALRLCLLLMNVRNFVRALSIEESPHHSDWMKEGVDYPRERQLAPELTKVVTVQNKLENGLELLRLQEEFLGLDVEDNDDEDDAMDNGNESDQ